MGLSSVELAAIAGSFFDGGALALVVAAVAVVLAYPIARTTHPALIVALTLTGPQARAFGVLAWGVAPGPVATGIALVGGATPMIALLFALRLSGRPRAWLDAAADLGAGPWTRLRLVEWPHLRSTVGIAVLWAVIWVLGDTTASRIAGGGMVYGPGPLASDGLLRDDAPARAAFVVALMLGAIILLCPKVARELGRQRAVWVRARVRAHGSLRVLGWAAWLMMLAPIAGLVRWLPTPSTARANELVLELGPQTALVALAVGSLAGLGGFSLAYRVRRRPAVAITTALLLPLAAPAGVVGATAALIARVVGIPPSDLLTIVALAIPSAALGFIGARIALQAVEPQLDDAAADLGAPPTTRLAWLWWPAARAAVLAVGFVAAAWSIAEATIAGFTAGPGGSILSTGMEVVWRAGDVGAVARFGLFQCAAVIVAAAAIAWASSARSARDSR